MMPVQAGEHQPYRHFGIDTGTAVVSAITVGDLFSEPRQVKYTLDPHQHVLVWNELPERSSN